MVQPSLNWKTVETTCTLIMTVTRAIEYIKVRAYPNRSHGAFSEAIPTNDIVSAFSPDYYADTGDVAYERLQ